MASADVLTSAPAKVTLFAEHLVTYDKIAVTTAADLWATCRLNSCPDRTWRAPLQRQ